MSFNPLMTLLARGLVDFVHGDERDVMELGNQTLNADDRVLKAVIGRSLNTTRIDVSALQALLALPPAERRARAGDYLRMLGFTDYQAIDVNDLYGSLVMDLNKDLRETYGYDRQFDLVTNNGTGEHVFNQDTIFRNTHQLARPGAVMIHSMPFVNYVNHGFYSFQPNLYYALALANGYDLLCMGVGSRTGHGFLTVPPKAKETVPEMLLGERRVPLGVMLSESKPPKAGLLYALAFALRPANEGRRFAKEIRRLQKHKANLMLFAILRKGPEETPFATPIQTRYEADIDDAALEQEYLAGRS